MMGDKKPEFAASTKLDSALARPRLKEGLISPATGIFLRIEEGPGSGRVYTLSSGGVYLIGRAGADIVLEDEKVSRKHAEIGLYGPGAFVLRDLASTNGTRLNGKRISEKSKLDHWDVIRVGDTSLRFAVIDDSIQVSKFAAGK
jgi:pSer/pThr/pTyr-binding forkhead associated (FHA) protein